MRKGRIKVRTHRRGRLFQLPAQQWESSGHMALTLAPIFASLPSNFIHFNGTTNSLWSDMYCTRKCASAAREEPPSIQHQRNLVYKLTNLPFDEEGTTGRYRLTHLCILQITAPIFKRSRREGNAKERPRSQMMQYNSRSCRTLSYADAADVEVSSDFCVARAFWTCIDREVQQDSQCS